MKTRELYETAIELLSASNIVRIVESIYDDSSFGNFIISFFDDEKERSLICDRGQIYFCNDLQGEIECRLITCSASETAQQDIADVLRAI